MNRVVLQRDKGRNAGRCSIAGEGAETAGDSWKSTAPVSCSDCRNNGPFLFCCCFSPSLNNSFDRQRNELIDGDGSLRGSLRRRRNQTVEMAVAFYRPHRFQLQFQFQLQLQFHSASGGRRLFLERRRRIPSS